MANRIKGITVEIGGDTTGLEKALKSVNTTIKSTQSALKDVNKLLKLDPSNTELLSQKQKLLKDAIGATKEKLDSLKQAQEQAKQQLENGTLGQDKYDALQREIIETEQELRRLQEQAATTNAALEKMDVIGSKMESVGNSISSAGQKMMPLTTVIGGLGIAAVKTAADFDSAMSQVAAVSGATGDDLQALRDKAREMGEKTKFSASEAAEAMNYMAMAGWKTEDMLGGLDGIMNLAAASGEDLAPTSDIVTDALTAFGLSASDSSHFADILAAASSNANTNVSTTVWNGIKSAITTPIEAAKNTGKSALDRISGFFSGCKLQLPHIKLPHFSISGSLSIAPPRVPHLSISWYKNGGIMTNPTIFGMNGSSLMAGGAAGAAAILPLKAFYDNLENILTDRLDMTGMEKYLAVIAANSSKGIYLEDGTLVGHLLPAIDSKLGQAQKLNRRLSL